MTCPFFRRLLAVAVLAAGASTVPIESEFSAGYCAHKFPAVDDIPHAVHLEERHRIVKRSLEHQLRIKVFYHDTVEKLPKTKRKIVEQVLNRLRYNDQLSYN